MSLGFFLHTKDGNRNFQTASKLEEQSNFQGGLAHPIETYAMALSALMLLADISEEGAYIRYWEILDRRQQQQQAFQEAFGLSISTFYDRYAQWLPDQLPSVVYLVLNFEWPGIKNLSKRQLDNILAYISVNPHFDSFIGEWSGLIWGGNTITSREGTKWSSRLSLTLISDDGCNAYLLGWYKDGELVPSEDQATLFEFAGTDTTITWTISDRPDKLDRLSFEQYEHCE